MNETVGSPGPMSIADAAAMLQVSQQAVRGLVHRERIVAYKLGRVWLVDRSSVEQLAEARGLITRIEGGSQRHSPGIPRMRALSFFSGAMGMDQGLERAGIETVLACEFDKWSRRTIEVNRPDLPLLGDIWRYDAAEIRQIAGLAPDDEIDLVVGGPPCQAFSTAGARRGFDDQRGNVFLHYIDLATTLRPKYIVIENVRGLLSAPMKHRPHLMRGAEYPALSGDELPGGALRFVIHLLEAEGYSVSFNLYNSANFGTPQVRERVILVCAREGGKVQHLVPTHSENESSGLNPWLTFGQVAEGLEGVEHHHINFPEARLRFYRLLKPGQYWKHLPHDLQQEAMGNSFFAGGGKTGFFRRLAWDRPSPTLVTHPAMPATDLAHPTEDRPLSIEEYKRIQEFPDTWNLQGPLVQQYKQVGNAVPLSLGAALGRVLIAHSEGKTIQSPAGFRYSRYKGTDDVTWLASNTAHLQRASRTPEPTLF